MRQIPAADNGLTSSRGGVGRAAGIVLCACLLNVAGPAFGQVGTTEVLESLYDLTHAEADLVRLVSNPSLLMVRL